MQPLEMRPGRCGVGGLDPTGHSAIISDLMTCGTLYDGVGAVVGEYWEDESMRCR